MIKKPTIDKLINTTDIEKNRDNEILKDLLNADSNLDLKTEIKKPLQLAIFQSFSNFISTKGFINCSLFLDDVIKTFLRYNISKDRQSRKEIISAIISMNEKEKPILTSIDKLTKSLE